MKLAPLKRRFIKMETLATTLFTNANLVLEGLAELQKSFDVLVQGNRILSVSQTPVEHEAANVIDIRGRTLIPGLIEAHAHITGFVAEPEKHLLPGLRNRHCRRQLLRCSLMDGFTSREAGGAPTTALHAFWRKGKSLAQDCSTRDAH